MLLESLIEHSWYFRARHVTPLRMPDRFETISNANFSFSFDLLLTSDLV